MLLLLRCLLLSVAVGLSAASAPCACEGLRTECSARGKTAIAPEDACPGSVVWVFCDNALTALPAAADAALQELDVAHNRIARADRELRALGSLRALDVSGNRLPHLRFLPEPCALRRLDASDNLLETLEGPLSGCAALEELSLQGNRLSAPTDGTFAALRSLRTLSLGDNPLRTLPPGVFRGLDSLRSLELRGAGLGALPADAFAGLGALRSLDLDANGLSTLSRAVLAGMPALEDLHLCDNRLATLPADALRDLRNLSALFLDHNELSQLPRGLLDGLPLVQLWAQGNRLERLPELRACCAALRVAAFDDNRVRAPAEAALRALWRPSLQRASLEGNPLRPEALAWAARARDVRMRADPEDCHCGQVAPRGGGAGASLCVEVECGPGARWADWAQAVRAAAASTSTESPVVRPVD